LRKREILFALAMGGLAAGGTALVLDDGSNERFVAVAAQGPDSLTDLAPFEAIATVGPQDVVVTYGETQSVRAEGSQDALALLEVVSEGGVLKIRPREGSWQWAWNGLNSTTYFVTVPRLTSVTLEGSGDIRVDKVEGPAFAGTIEGSGDLSVDSLTVERAEFSVSGTGDITAAGTARDARLSIEGPGNIRANGLRSETAFVSVEGPGDAKLTVDRLANVSLEGPGDVEISGPARCSVNQEGPGDVDCEGGTD
jgi:hypothetical protein